MFHHHLGTILTKPPIPRASISNGSDLLQDLHHFPNRRSTLSLSTNNAAPTTGVPIISPPLMATLQGDPAKLHPPLYGTFPPPPPPSAVPPPCAAQPLPPQYHVVPVGYQSYAGTPVVAEGVPVKIVRVREPRLPICGIGIGWSLFVAGFFFAAVPWYVGAFILLFVHIDEREKAGLVACAVAAVLAAITAFLGLSGNNLLW